MIESYGKVWSRHHSDADALAGKEVVVQEKIDGSQFSFGVKDGKLFCRSKNAEIDLHAPQKLFKRATETAIRLFEEGLLPEGVVVRGEAVENARHNTIAYERAAEHGVVVFDVGGYVRRGAFGLASEAAWFLYSLEQFCTNTGLEQVPTLAVCRFASALPGVPVGPADIHWSRVEALVAEHKAFLGGDVVEGAVVKAPGYYDRMGKPLKAKYVIPGFKEINAKNHKKQKPGLQDIVRESIPEVCTEARLMKVLQHLREEGKLVGEMRDLKHIIPAFKEDVRVEATDYVVRKLAERVMPEIVRRGASWIPVFYQNLLSAEGNDA